MAESPMNSSSLFTADELTYLKMVVVAFLGATLVVWIGIAARLSGG
jgi:hypothetical protein